MGLQFAAGGRQRSPAAARNHRRIVHCRLRRSSVWVFLRKQPCPLFGSPRAPPTEPSSIGSHKFSAPAPVHASVVRQVTSSAHRRPPSSAGTVRAMSRLACIRLRLSKKRAWHERHNSSQQPTACRSLARRPSRLVQLRRVRRHGRRRPLSMRQQRPCRSAAGMLWPRDG